MTPTIIIMLRVLIEQTFTSKGDSENFDGCGRKNPLVTPVQAKSPADFMSSNFGNQDGWGKQPPLENPSIKHF